MEFSYFEKALSSASKEEYILLLKFLEDPRTEEVRNSVEQNALIIEATSWKIAFYSQEDINDAVRYLKQELNPLVPA
jgi:hypothetical protein